jgi:hypothetical protein
VKEFNYLDQISLNRPSREPDEKRNMTGRPHLPQPEGKADKRHIAESRSYR